MEPSDLRERWVPSVNQVDRVFLEHLELRETPGLLVPRAALDCKDPEENLENLAWPESLD